jgi:hypothetical protein
MVILVAIIVLWGSTLGIVALDKSARAKTPVPDEVAMMRTEPSWGAIIAICVVFNIAALPYYFYSTRRSGLWGLIGFGAFLGCFVLMVVAQVIVTMATGVHV